MTFASLLALLASLPAHVWVILVIAWLVFGIVARGFLTELGAEAARRLLDPPDDDPPAS